ncbi:MAG: hypothetical protein MJ224_01650 [archaeon]|nr:hypothetical protein [archaeon]
MGKILKNTTNSEIISFFLNVNPDLLSEVNLPTQGEDLKHYGELIVNNDRFKNKFINTVNLIGLTVIKENRWENPWDTFAMRGTLRFGQQIREVIQDLAKVFDYNENYNDKSKFLETQAPDVYQYMHELNYQKYYEVTVNESELRLAFEDTENGLYKFIEDTISNLYETYSYDKYLVDKYQLCRRILDGTIPVKKIDNYNSKTPREILSIMKGVSNKMTFKSPNYNPAGVRRATKHSNQYLMLDAEREAITSTEVLATSYFLNEAEVKTNLALIDSFSETDNKRLAELLKNDYKPLTDSEINQLKSVIGLIISDDFFMDYYYQLDGSNDGKTQREFTNPTSLDRNIFLHAWLCISTSPFANCCVFTSDTPAVTSVTINPSELSMSAGLDVQLTPTVATTGFANKAVVYTVEEAPGEQEGSLVTVDTKGLVHIPVDYEPTDTEDPNPVIIRATSIYDDTKYADATITVL